jgi:hypothetical protein
LPTKKKEKDERKRRRESFVKRGKRFEEGKVSL